MHILVSMPSHQGDKARDWAQALQHRLPTAQIAIDTGAPVDQTVDYLVTWQPRAGLLAQVPNARAIFTASAGVDALMNDPTLPHCPVVRLCDAGMGDQMASFALYAAFHYWRGFDRMRVAQNRASWSPDTGAVAPRPSVGVLGLGALGQVTARALREAGFPVSGWSRRKRDIDGVSTYAGSAEFEEFLAQTNLLICLLPLTPDTHHLLDHARFAAMPREAVVVNLARGDILVEGDLLAALDNGHLRGAMLDVFATEPLAEDHPFWAHEKVVVTPHIAAETLVEPGADQISDNINRIERGDKPLGAVDRDAGY